MRWTTKSKWTAIIHVHFGWHFTFFLQLTLLLTHCILSRFCKLSLFFLCDLTQTGDSIYFLSGRVYSLGYSLAQGLFGKEFHFAPPSSPSHSEMCPLVWGCVWLLLLWFSDRFRNSGNMQRFLSLELRSSHWQYLSLPYCSVYSRHIYISDFATVLSLWLLKTARMTILGLWTLITLNPSLR